MTLGVIGGMEANNQITIFVVFMTRTLHKFLISKQDNFVDGKGWHVNSTNFFNFTQTTGSMISGYPIEGLNNVNKISVLAISYNGNLNNSGIEIYVNGKKTTPVSWGGPITLSPSSNGNEDLRIGAREGNTFDWYNGLIGEIIIFQSRLSAQEIDAINQYLIKKWL